MPSVRCDSIFKPDIFKDKVIFATGANSGGICSTQVEALLRHGCNGAIFGRRKELSIKAAKEFEDRTGRQCLGLSGDVRDYETLQRAVKETMDKFGRIDFVIAGAAGNFLSPVSQGHFKLFSAFAFALVSSIDRRDLLSYAQCKRGVMQS